MSYTNDSSLRVFLILSALLAACSGDGRRIEERIDASMDWQLSVALGGGFAGEAQEFAIDGAAGTTTARDIGRQFSATEPLVTADRRALTELIAKAPTDDVERMSPTCADCYQYQLQVVRSASRYTARYDSLTLAGSGHEALILKAIGIGRQVLEK